MNDQHGSPRDTFGQDRSILGFFLQGLASAFRDTAFIHQTNMPQKLLRTRSPE
jgi:hypothetical protein